MKKFTMPGASKQFSQLMFGADKTDLDNYEESVAILDDVLALGINAIDTAVGYVGGNSERALGKWMQERGNREEVFILTKGAHHNRDRNRVTPYDITADLMDSLTRLKTDYIDLYLLHRDDTSQPVGPIVDILNEHHKAGRIHAFGGSNWTHQRIAEANAYAKEKGLLPMVASSPNYSLCDQVEDPWGKGCVTIGGTNEVEARAFYKESNIPVFAYSSLGRGMFSGRITRENYKEMLDAAALRAYAHEVNFKKLDRAHVLAEKKGVKVPQIAIAYLLNQPFQVIPLVRPATKQEAIELLQTSEMVLTEEERNWLDFGD
jgi:aryl-alcohol dehydrogenase-like predicted oxidoreductase